VQNHSAAPSFCNYLIIGSSLFGLLLQSLFTGLSHQFVDILHITVTGADLHMNNCSIPGSGGFLVVSIIDEFDTVVGFCELCPSNNVADVELPLITDAASISIKNLLLNIREVY
jgi:hypothetical protein